MLLSPPSLGPVSHHRSGVASRSRRRSSSSRPGQGVVRMADNNRASADQSTWVRSYVDAWNAHDVSAVLDLMTDDVVWVDRALGERVEGAGAVREFFGSMETTLSSDYHLEAGQSISDERGYALEWT